MLFFMPSSWGCVSDFFRVRVFAQFAPIIASINWQLGWDWLVWIYLFLLTVSCHSQHWFFRSPFYKPWGGGGKSGISGGSLEDRFEARTLFVASYWPISDCRFSPPEKVLTGNASTTQVNADWFLHVHVFLSFEWHPNEPRQIHMDVIARLHDFRSIQPRRRNGA